MSLLLQSPYEAAAMEDLPDEMLLRVFSLPDGLTLLDSIPLVCKRWRRVACDPLAWSNVEVDWSWRLDQASMVLHAPPCAASTWT